MRMGSALTVLTFAAIVLFSNFWDWDHFYAFLETDRRSWLVDHRAPLWTYQLCAGVTRIGDPQAFGLSPLFLPVLLLGSFWGAKVLLLGCTALGAGYFVRILDRFDPVRDEASPVIHRSLALFLFTSNYFAWHYAEGHLTFALVPFLFVPIYYALKGAVDCLTRMEGLAFGASAFAYVTAGIYHSAMFFALPMGALSALFLLRQARLARSGVSVRGGVLVLLVAALAVALGAYKWRGVLDYQRLHPRLLDPMEKDVTGLGALVAYLFLPTVHEKLLGLFEGGVWRIHEYSAFSVVVWIAAFSAYFLRRERKLGGPPLLRPTYGREALVGLVFLVLLILSDDSPVPLFAWLNRAFGGQVRVPTRFQIALLTVATVWTWRALASSRALRALYVRWIAPVGVVVTFGSCLTFLPHLETAIFRAAQHGTGDPSPGKLRTLSLDWNFLFSAVRQGQIVPNCYNPIQRETKLVRESEYAPWLAVEHGKIDLVSSEIGPISEACRASAFVSQNAVEFDESACPVDLCFVLNDLNLPDTAKLAWDAKRKLFCRR